MRLLLLDVDGTLVDSAAILLEAQRLTLARHGLPFPGREAGLAIVGLSLREAFLALVGPDAPADDLAATYKAVFHELRAGGAFPEPLYPGVAEVLPRLAARAGVKLGIATGKSRPGAAHLIARHGWEGLFATVQTADDAPSKPDPAMVRQAMAEAGAEPARTIMLGDATFDMIMARAAGARAVGVAWGFRTPAALLAAGAERIIDRFAEVEALVDAL